MSDFKKKAGVFANLVAGSTKKAAIFAARKTKNTALIAKLNMNISSRRDVIKHAYGEIGKLYYETHKDAPEGFFVQLCQEIDLAMEDIAAMESEIVRLKTEGSEQAVDADFESVVSENEAEADPDIEVEFFEETETETPEPPEMPEVPEAPEAPIA